MEDRRVVGFFCNPASKRLDRVSVRPARNAETPPAEEIDTSTCSDRKSSSEEGISERAAPAMSWGAPTPLRPCLPELLEVRFGKQRVVGSWSSGRLRACGGEAIMATRLIVTLCAR